MDDLKLIKKDYGEKMAHFCRDNFPTVLETPGLLYETLSKVFYLTRALYEDIVNNGLEDRFISIINEELPSEDNEEEINSNKTVEELFSEAGYDIYECKTEADIQSFRHFYYRKGGKPAPEYIEGLPPFPYEGEELCTFSGDRLKRCHVFFAVKKNASELKREDFKNPEREDEYGTSVISIQITKGQSKYLSIKNRYNHSVKNPDATFSNNLDNIIPGLTKAFEKQYGYTISDKKKKRDFPGYVRANDGRNYKYNIECDAIYYCPDNIIIYDGEVKHFDKSRYLVFDRFILDMKEKIIRQYGKDNYKDSFINDLKHIKSIKVESNKETKEKTITINEDIIIVLNSDNQIKSYKNDHIDIIDNNFLMFSLEVEEIDLPNVIMIGDKFMFSNYMLTKLNLPNCWRIGDSFLNSNNSLVEVNLPEVETIGSDFIFCNTIMERVNMPKLESVGPAFLYSNRGLTSIKLPKLVAIAHSFMFENLNLEEIYLPNVRSIARDFLFENKNLRIAYLPKVETIGNSFLGNNEELVSIDFPRLTKVGDDFLYTNKKIESVNLPKLEETKNNFLEENLELKELSLPSLKIVKSFFLGRNKKLSKIELPKLEELDDNILYSNEELEEVLLPNLKAINKYSNIYSENKEEKTKYLFPNNSKVKVIIGEDNKQK